MAGIQRRLQGIHVKSGDYEIPIMRFTPCISASPHVQQGPRAARRRLCHVNTRSAHGHERRPPRRHQSREKLTGVWFGRADANVLDRYTRQRRKAQVDYVQAQTIQNKKALEEKDPKIRRGHLDELRRTSEDVARHKKFLYRSSLFDSLNSANAVE